MIDNHHLAYAGVLLVFLAGAAIIAMASLLFLATGALAAVAVRIIKHLAHGRVPDRACKGRKAVERPLPMEEALRQVAAGKAASPQERLQNGKENTVPLRPKAGSRQTGPHRSCATVRAGHRPAKAKTPRLTGTIGHCLRQGVRQP